MSDVMRRCKRINLPKGALLLSDANGSRWIHQGNGEFLIVGKVPTLLEYHVPAGAPKMPAPEMETITLDDAPTERRVWFLPFEKEDNEHNRQIDRLLAGKGGPA